MAEFSRPASGFRFKNMGMKTNAAPDALPEFKYPYLQNIRGFNENDITSRPQIGQITPAPTALQQGPVVSLEPVLGVYKIKDRLFVNGVSIDVGYLSGLPASILPFRPNASPNAYDYVFDDAKGSKITVNQTGTIVQKIGIAEPQAPPDICQDYFLFTPADPVAAAYVQSGVAGVPTNITRSTETILTTIQHPASVPSFGLADPRCSLQVGTTQKYSIGETVAVAGGGGTENCVLQDVIPPTSTALSITAIRYAAGLTGKCVIVTSIVGQTGGIIEFIGQDPSALPVSLQSFLTSFRRGAIISLTGGVTAEKVLLLSASLGPQGALCLEVTTASNHAAGESLSIVSTLVLDVAANRTGQVISSSGIQTVTTGAGTGNLDAANTTLLNNFFTNFNGGSVATQVSPRIDDYIHLSINVSDLTLLTSIRIYLDVDSATNDFAHNAYYFEIQPNDLTAAVAGTQTQLGATAVALQRIGLRGGVDRASHPFPIVRFGEGAFGLLQSGDDATGFGGAGDTTTLGQSQWSEIFFPISALTRIGNDQTRTLANIQKIRFQVVCTAALTVQISSTWLGGGNPPDTGVGLPYLYRIRPRNSATGTKGNPSPSTRYGAVARRQDILIALPSAAYDTQIDTWDVFRFGGQINSWRYIGSGAPNTTFQDNLFDSSIINSDVLSFDQHEPFPGIGPPITTATATVTGTQLLATFPLATIAAGSSGFGTLTQLGNMLPGTQINIANNIFTLWNRPTLISITPGVSQTWLFQLQENAGSQVNPIVLIQEPVLGNQNSNNVWGPDTNGRFFSVMSGTANNGGVQGLRPGVVQWTNANDPDAASDANTRDICPPSEPLQNGEMLGPTPVVFSSNRAWRGFPKADGSYNWISIPTGAGLAGQFALCSDGEFIYFLAKDGIRMTAGGDAPSLTDEDLYNLFPHEGLPGQTIVYAGQTIFPPDFTYSGNFQLNVVNRYLYFDYLDSSKTQRTLVCDLRNRAWSIDAFIPNPVSIHVGVTLPSSTQSAVNPTLNQQVFLGDTLGTIYTEVPSIPGGEQVNCVVIPRAEMLGDIRSNKMFGDCMLDAAVPGGAISINPILFGNLLPTVTVIAGNQAARPQNPYLININGQQIARSLGLAISWTDQGQNNTLYSWQPTYINQPEDITNRFTDWDNAGSGAAKFFQGFLLEADTQNQLKQLTIRSSDDLGIKGIFQIQHNGQQQKAYSFAQPFIAHLVRIEPDNVSWRMFNVKWVVQATPEAALNWITQATSHSLPGYQHVPQMLFAYNAPAPVTITLIVDGLALAPIVIPLTVGYQKFLVKFPANKGFVFQYSAVSNLPFQVWNDDIEILVGEHGRSGSYKTVKLLGSELGAKAAI